jgi:high-affinity Fe2+/Pb2+ permease
MTEQVPDRPDERLTDFPSLGARLRALATGLAVVTLLAIVVDGMVRGLSFGSMVLWLSVFAVFLLVGTAVSVALHALRGAGEAQRRGERLSGEDVGILPRRRVD